MKYATLIPIKTSALSYLVLALVCGCLSACATSRKSAYLKATTDNVLIFDRTKTVSVSALNRDNLAELNLSDLVKDLLSRSGVKVGSSTNYDYILKVSTAAGTTSKTIYKTAVSTSYSSVAIAGLLGNVSTNTYTSVPTQEQSPYKAISLTLWDAQDMNRQLPVIWRGTIVGPTQTINGHEIDAVQQLITRIGITAEVNLTLVPDSTLPSGAVTSPQAESITKTASPAWSEYFSVQDTQINEYVSTFKGKKFDGYVKTRHIKTKQFDGFVQTQGLEKYGAPQSEIESWSLGLGAYIVRGDGVYTVDGGDVRNLVETTAQKVVSLPLKVGETNIVTPLPGTAIEYTLERIEALDTPAGRFEDCAVIKYVLSTNGQRGVDSTRNWFCKDVGFAKQLVEKGATSTLTNVIHSK